MFVAFSDLDTSPVLVKESSRDLAIELARDLFQKSFGKVAKITKIVEVYDEVDEYEGDQPLRFDEPWYNNNLYSFDTETNTHPRDDSIRIVEIAVARFDRDARGFVPEFQTLLSFPGKMSPGATKVNGIRDEDLEGKPSFEEVKEELLSRFDGIWICHNRSFDVKMILKELTGNQYILPPVFCSLKLARDTNLGQKNNKLGTLGELFDIDIKNTHRAMDDTLLCGEVFLKLAKANRPFLKMSTRQAIGYFDGRI